MGTILSGTRVPRAFCLFPQEKDTFGTYLKTGNTSHGETDGPTTVRRHVEGRAVGHGGEDSGTGDTVEGHFGEGDSDEGPSDSYGSSSVSNGTGRAYRSRSGNATFTGYRSSTRYETTFGPSSRFSSDDVRNTGGSCRFGG